MSAGTAPTTAFADRRARPAAHDAASLTETDSRNAGNIRSSNLAFGFDHREPSARPRGAGLKQASANQNSVVDKWVTGKSNRRESQSCGYGFDGDSATGSPTLAHFGRSR